MSALLCVSSIRCRDASSVATIGPIAVVATVMAATARSWSGELPSAQRTATAPIVAPVRRNGQSRRNRPLRDRGFDASAVAGQTDQRSSLHAEEGDRRRTQL